MKTSAAFTSLIFLSLTVPAFAHRLDEYLQATIISLEEDRVVGQINLTPGVAVFPLVMATIDTNLDGVISSAEQVAYAKRVLADLSLSIDGDRMGLELISAAFPKIETMKEGFGDIQVDFAASFATYRRRHELVFENHHQGPISAYLVNCLAPRDPEIRVVAQRRNYEQSRYQVEYSQSRLGMLSLARWAGSRGVIALAGLALLIRFAILWNRKWTSEGSASLGEGTSGGMESF